MERFNHIGKVRPLRVLGEVLGESYIERYEQRYQLDPIAFQEAMTALNFEGLIGQDLSVSDRLKLKNHFDEKLSPHVFDD